MSNNTENTDILTHVKKALGLGGTTFHDDALNEHIATVKRYMVNGGVSEDIVNSEEAFGCIERGVSDIWDYGSGGTNLSPFFYELVIQLASKTTEQKQSGEVVNNG